MTEIYPDNNPKTAQGALKIDLSLVPPSALIAEARVMALGAKKYGPYNWREKIVSSRVYTAAALRHIFTWQDGEDIDSESGESHLAHARACLGILIDAKSLDKLNDNRPSKGAAGRLLVPIQLKAPQPAADVLQDRLAQLEINVMGSMRIAESEQPLTDHQMQYAESTARAYYARRLGLVPAPGGTWALPASPLAGELVQSQGTLHGD